MSLAPGTTQEKTLIGPATDQVFQGNTSGTLLLYLNNISIDPFQVGKMVSFQYDYSYTLRTISKSMPVVTRTLVLSQIQAQKQNGKVVITNGAQ